VQYMIYLLAIFDRLMKTFVNIPTLNKCVTKFYLTFGNFNVVCWWKWQKYNFKFLLPKM